MISVIVTTFNGERYILKQLESIARQTRRADEVLVFDDHSGDGTVGLVKDFISSHQLSDTWRVFVQEKNQGWRKNFYDGIGAAQGDILFFSDQDDIWREEKIEVMASLMQESGAGCVYGGYAFIDDKDHPVAGADQRLQVAVAKEKRLFNTIVTMGCRMCISRPVADLYLKLKAPEFAYDSQCGRLAYLYFGLVPISRVVLDYRIHGGNNSGIQASLEEGSLTLEKRMEEIKENISWLEKLICYEKESRGENLSLLESVLVFQKRRLSYLGGESCFLGGGIDLRLYRDKGMLLGDLAYRHRVNQMLGNLKGKWMGVRSCHR